MKCHICDNQYEELYHCEKDWRKVYTCGSCNHMHILFIGDEVNYHAKEYRKQGGEGVKKDKFENNNLTEDFHSGRRAEICKKRVEYIKEYIEKDFLFYEVGAGAGTFAREMKKNNLISNLYVCNEVAPILIAECKRLGFDVDEKDINKIKFNQKYDIIFAWHVIEHIKDFQPLVEKIRDNIKKYFVIEVPTNTLAMISRKKEWDGHTHYFSQQSFRMFFEKVGFEIIDIRDGIQSKADRPSILATMRKK
jgi:hypothetical protein